MSTLKKPLFINGMYNREGKNCRAPPQNVNMAAAELAGF